MNTNRMVFVFGSNEAGIHGAGAARYAYKHRGAILGVGYGHTHINNEFSKHSFAIPTKGFWIRKTLPLQAIRNYVDGFLTYAGSRMDLEFQITQIGCGLAGLKAKDIAPMFSIHPSNCWFDKAWEEFLPEGTKFWGTF